MAKITFVMGHMGIGGAEQVATTLIEALVDRYDEISLINMSHVERDYFQLPDKLKHIHLNLERSATTYLDTLLNVSKRIRHVRHAIQTEKPDLIISFTDRTNVITLLAIRNLNIPVIVSVHTHPFQNGVGLRMLCRGLYPHADLVHYVSHGVASAYSYIASEKQTIIYNPISNIGQLDKAQPAYLDPKSNHIISLGRLAPEKGFDLLITAFAKFHTDFPNWKLTIFGEGNERPSLESLIFDLGLNDTVTLPGSIKDPFSALKAADIFVQSSHREGFSVALLEAMACGLPCIVTDHTGNPREVITSDENGIIIPLKNISALSTTLKNLLLSEHDRLRLGNAAKQVRYTFTPEKIARQWQIAIDRILDPRKV